MPDNARAAAIEEAAERLEPYLAQSDGMLAEARRVVATLGLYDAGYAAAQAEIVFYLRENGRINAADAVALRFAILEGAPDA